MAVTTDDGELWTCVAGTHGQLGHADRAHQLAGAQARRCNSRITQASAHIQHPRSRTCLKMLAGLRLPRGPRQHDSAQAQGCEQAGAKLVVAALRGSCTSVVPMGRHTVAGARWQNLESQVDTTAELHCGCTHRPMPASCSPHEDPSHPPQSLRRIMVSRTNTTRDPKSKAGPCKLHSKFPKSCSVLGVLGSTVGICLGSSWSPYIGQCAERASLRLAYRINRYENRSWSSWIYLFIFFFFPH